MPQPPEVSAAADRLTGYYTATQQALLAQIADAATSPRARTRLRALLTEIDGHIARLRGATATWLTQEVPGVYGLGAGASAEVLGVGWSWTQIHMEAVQALAVEAWDSIGASLQQVAAHTRRAIRELAEDGARRQILEGIPGRVASTEYLAELRARTGLVSVTYSDGTRRALADYADTVSRTTAARAHNAGSITLSIDEGVGWMECIDGPDCGLTSHDDTQLADGLVVPVETAQAYPLSHPRCARSWGPRPDVRSAEEADSARRWGAGEQEGRAATERARSAGELVQGQRPGYYARQARRPRAARAARQPRPART